MKIYFINLDRSPERLLWFTKQINRMHVDTVRVQAVDAQFLKNDELQHWRRLSSGHNSLSAGEIGCLLSHRKAWQAVIDGDDEWAFVAEDDIHFSIDADQFLVSDRWIPEGADLIKAETNLRRHELSYTVWGAPFGHEIRRLRSHHFGSGGYFISPRAAQELLLFTEKTCEPVDAILFSPNFGMLEQLNTLQIIPAICIQDVFMKEHADTSALTSIIDHERSEEHRANKKRTTTPFTKIAREASRLRRQIGNLLMRVHATAARKSVFTIVSFGKTQ